MGRCCGFATLTLKTGTKPPERLQTGNLTFEECSYGEASSPKKGVMWHSTRKRSKPGMTPLQDKTKTIQCKHAPLYRNHNNLKVSPSNQSEGLSYSHDLHVRSTSRSHENNFLFFDTQQIPAQRTMKESDQAMTNRFLAKVSHRWQSKYVMKLKRSYPRTALESIPFDTRSFFLLRLTGLGYTNCQRVSCVQKTR
jgi:hypothetical protein